MLIKVSEAANLLNLTDRAIYKMIDKKELKKYEEDTILVDKVEVLLKKPTIITLFNQKGGAGKTSSSALLADYFDIRGIKTLVIDFDQQANLSQFFFDYEEIINGKTIYHYFAERKGIALEKIVRKYNDNIDIIPSDLRLANKDFIDSTVLINYKDEYYDFFKKYQVVIIDCPPALNSFARFGLLLANYVFIPLIEEKLCYLGVADALNTITTIKRINPDFLQYFAFASKHKGQRTIIHENYYQLYKNEFKDNFLEPIIPDFVGIAERPDAMENIFKMYDNEMTGRIKDLCDEIYDVTFEGR